MSADPMPSGCTCRFDTGPGPWHLTTCPIYRPTTSRSHAEEQRAARVRADLERAIDRLKQHHNRALGDC